MKEKYKPFTQARFNYLKKAYEKTGYKVLTKWRKGLKIIKLNDIVLTPRNNLTKEEK